MLRLAQKCSSSLCNLVALLMLKNSKRNMNLDVEGLQKMFLRGKDQLRNLCLQANL